MTGSVEDREVLREVMTLLEGVRIDNDNNEIISMDP